MKWVLVAALLWLTAKNAIAQDGVLLDANFASSQHSFSYSDDTFRGTTAPLYASGSYQNGSLRVILGGIDDADIFGISGGWTREFTVPQDDSQLSVAITYRMDQSAFYESNEFSQVLCSLDGTLLPTIAQLTGDGNTGGTQTVGFQTATLTTGRLSSGSHTITIGGYNNLKTLANEVTVVYITRVVIAGSAPVPPPVGSPAPPPVASLPSPNDTIRLQASFSTGTDDFVFRGGRASQYARGDLQNGALKVTLGGIDGNTISNISGGWERTFRLSTAAPVRISLRYRLNQAGTEEAEELSQALVSVDGVLIGQKPYDILAQLSGDGNSGPPITTGWKVFESDIGLMSAGLHTLVVGGYLTRKTLADEVTEVFFDDIVVQTTAATTDTTFYPQQIVNRLSFQRFKDNIATLASFGDRLQGTQSYFNSANWVASALRSYGYSIERAPYTFRGAPRDSIYVTKVGSKFPDRMFIVSAHLDGRGNGGAADDDASGCSLVLEIARVLGSRDVQTEISVRLVFWNNEESGLNGSIGYVNSRRSLQGIESPAGSGRYPEPTWLGMIQHDMILFDHGLPPRLNQIENADCDVEYQASSIFAPLSRQLAEALLQGNSRYAEFYPAQMTNDMSNTDSVAFQDYAPSCSFRENRRRAEIGAGSNPHWHQPSDVYSTYSELDFLFGFNIVQTTLGTVAEVVDATII